MGRWWRGGGVSSAVPESCPRTRSCRSLPTCLLCGGCPTLSGRPANLCCLYQSCLSVDGQKFVSAALSHLPLEGSAAPAEGLGKWPAPLRAEQLFPEATLVREGCHRHLSCPALGSHLRSLFALGRWWQNSEGENAGEGKNLI